MSQAKTLGWSILLLAVGLGSLTLAGGPPGIPETVPPLAAGDWTLSAEDTHRYRVELAAGDFLELDIEQLGIDLSVAVLDPARRQLLAVDSPYGDRESEAVLLVAEMPGPHTVEISAGGGENGAYRVRLVAHRPATEQDRLRKSAARAYDRGEEERRSRAPVDALGHYAEAAAQWRSAGDQAGEALAWHRIGQVRMKLGDREAALDAYRTASRLAEAAGRRVRLADLCYGIGKIHFDAAKYQDAMRSYGDAAELYAELGDGARQAKSLTQIAWSNERLGELDAAREIYGQSLELVRNLGDLILQGAMLNNLGEVELRLGRPRAALELFRDALELRRRAADERGEAITLTSLGTAIRRLQLSPATPQGAMPDLEEAREHFVAAWQIQRRIGDLEKLTNTLIGLGLTELGLGRLKEAERALRTAAKVARKTGQRRNEGIALLGLAEVYEVRAEHREALEILHRALAILRQLGDVQGEASAAFVIARNERVLGRLESAREWLEAALERMESIRGRTGPELLRASYFSFKHPYHEAYVDLLMELHGRDPERGLAARALEASERGRARVLLESLRLPGPEWPIPDIERLQRQILDADTLLIEIALGKGRSHLWAVDTSSMTTHELPGRARLETLARQAQRTLASSRTPSAHIQARLALEDLSRIVLGPIAERLGRRRLVVVASGALQAVPFAALPDPRTLKQEEPAPLLVSHEVVTAPSLAVIDALRNRARSWSKTVAVIADPVFTTDDPRLPPKAPSAEEPVDTEATNLPRLPFTAEEAAAILALVAPNQRLAALGFDASLDLVRSGALADVRFVHFATHGLVDAEHAERSRLALSRFDVQGRPRPEMLEAREIAGLDLAADLVVLSACRTALGQEMRGEGLMSLARVFLLAGASRAVVSLWQVDDRATAALMERFYRALLVDGLAPPAALRSAQMAIRAEERWQALYYWAGLVLQGDWL